MVEREHANSLGVTQERFESALEREDVQALQLIVKEIPLEDLGVLLTTLSNSSTLRFAELAGSFLNLEILNEVGDHQKKILVEALNVPERIQDLDHWETDDILSLMDAMSWDDKRRVLETVSPQHRELLKTMSSYPEETVARLVEQCDVVVPEIWRVEEVIHHIQQMPQAPEDLTEIYAVSLRNRLVGVCNVGVLLRADPKEVIQNLLQDVRSISASASQQDLIYLCRHYGLSSVPVEDADGKLLGVVSASNILEVSEEEAEDNLLKLAGVVEQDDAAPLYLQAVRRLLWLVVVVVNSFLSALVIKHYQSVFEHKGVLAALMTLVSSVGGAAGTQVLTVSIRSIALKLFQVRGLPTMLMRELSINIVTGVISGVCLMAVVYFWLGDAGLALLVCVSLLFQLCFAAITGVIIPWAVHCMGFDPTVGAAPLVMALSDILGFALFLWLAKFFIA